MTRARDLSKLLGGTTPTLTVGSAGTEDTKLVFDGNAQDYHIGFSNFCKLSRNFSEISSKSC